VISKRALTMVSVLATSALCGAVVFEGGPDPVIFPKQDIPIYFNHDYHVRTPDEKTGVSGEGLDCDFCHENVSDSEKSSDRDIPGHDSCDGCHEEWIGEEEAPAPIKECARCHLDLAHAAAQSATTADKITVKKIDIPRPNIIFPHAAHTKAEVQCIECHDRVPKKTVATRDDFPTMDRCVECHSKEGASVECTTCHYADSSGRIVTRFRDGELKPNRLHSYAIHDANFLDDHAVAAQRNKSYCDNCHKEDYCLSCHDGTTRDVRYHPGDWVSMHYIAGKKDDTRCQSCHRLQSFCLDCHVRSGIATIQDVSRSMTRRTVRVNKDTKVATGPHPMGYDWVERKKSRNFHGFHAQRNIRACASCHQEQYCLQCHSSKMRPGGVGRNPHGPNPQRLKGSVASKRNARMCLKCHLPSDDAWR
jgi:hypothetical protein